MGVRRDEPIALKGLQRQLDELGKRLKAVGAELQVLEEQWLQLSEALTA
jgi:prefoldin subunit 5